jgi:hypothetical protein
MIRGNPDILYAFGRMNAAQSRSEVWAKARPLILVAAMIAAIGFGAYLDHVVFPKLIAAEL